MEASTKQCIRETFQKKALRTVPSLKLISFLRPPVYPLQIPKPPSVILTNEAIKFRVANSFELHLLSKSFNIPTTVSPSLSRLFSMLGSLLTRDHRLTLFCHSFPEGKKARRREMGREIPPACFFFFSDGNFPCVYKKGLALWMRSLQFPCSNPSRLISPLLLPVCLEGYLWIRLTLIQLASHTI